MVSIVGWIRANSVALLGFGLAVYKAFNALESAINSTQDNQPGATESQQAPGGELAPGPQSGRAAN